MVFPTDWSRYWFLRTVRHLTVSQAYGSMCYGHRPVRSEYDSDTEFREAQEWFAGVRAEWQNLTPQKVRQFEVHFQQYLNEFLPFKAL